MVNRLRWASRDALGVLRATSILLSVLDMRLIVYKYLLQPAFIITLSIPAARRGITCKESILQHYEKDKHAL